MNEQNVTALENFKKLGLSDTLIRALIKKGFEEPTSIQAKTIPLLLNDDRDIIGQAQTGTGKTAAFGLPIIDKLKKGVSHVQALILTPTRELTIQVCAELNSFKGLSPFRIVPIYGGQSIEMQARQLRSSVDIVVGTPGRVIDHMQNRRLDLSKLDYFVLDEADEMLNIGFVDDIEKIFSKTDPDKKTLLFSATMPPKIVKLAEKYMKDYLIVRTEKSQLTTSLTEQIYFEVRKSEKLEALCRIIDIEEDFYGLIFCRTKRDVDDITEILVDRGYNAEALHGDFSQYQRERIMDKFRKQKSNILIATDVASRGLDINNLSHVINYSLPQDPESYVHRIGRTGRAGKPGTAITFITPSEYRKLVIITKTTKTNIRKQKVPTIKTIIANKQQRMKENIKNILKDGVEKEYLDFAQSLLEEGGASETVAGLLKMGFEADLAEQNYNEIQEPTVDKKGKTRLFVAKGKIDRMTPRNLVQFIEQKSKVYGKRIQEVQVYDKFSFITVSFKDAEIIIDAFRSLSPNRQSLVERAKKK